MDNDIYLALLLYKSVIEADLNFELSYKVLGPMMGTIEKDVFINTNDRKYYSIEKTKANIDKNIRYLYYNLISLREAKKKYHTNNVLEVVEKYFNDSKNDSYYVICKENSNPLIIKYDQERFIRKYESNVAKELI